MKRRGRRLLRKAGLWAGIVALALVAVLALGLTSWIAYTGSQRQQRETQDAHALGDGRWVDVGDVEMHLREWGEAGDPLLLLAHGAGAWSATWSDLPAALAAAGWRVVAIDLPPFGLTPAVGAGFDYTRAAQARRLLAIVDALGGGPVSLVAHAAGAGPALEAAMQGGARVRQVVLVDPSLGLGEYGEPPSCDGTGLTGLLLANRPWRTSLVAASVTWPGLTATWLGQAVQHREVLAEAIVATYQVPLRRRGFSAALGDWAAAFVQGSCEKAKSLDPALLRQWALNGPPRALIWGREDSVTPLAQSESLLRWMPGTAMRVIPGVGHIPHLEAPQALASALLGVLQPPR